MEDLIVESPTVSQLKEHIQEMTVHRSYFAHPDAPFDKESMMECELKEIVGPDFWVFSPQRWTPLPWIRTRFGARCNLTG